MSEPVIAAKVPKPVMLKPGEKYYWCACGRSKDQPFCDGSHEGTDFTPLEFSVEEEKKYALCQCKHTKTSPFCDGTHKTLD